MIFRLNFSLLRRIWTASGPFIFTYNRSSTYIQSYILYTLLPVELEHYTQRECAHHNKVHEDEIKSTSGIENALYGAYSGRAIVRFFNHRVGKGI